MRIYLLGLLALTSVIATQQPRDLVQRLMPNGDPNSVRNPSPEQRDRVISQLRIIQEQAKGERLLDVTFLLAVYGFDYQKNRDAIVRNLQACTTVSHKSSAAYKYGCNYRAVDCLFVLYKRGRKDALQPMLLFGKDASNAMVREAAGSNGADALVGAPADFLGAIRSLPLKTQKDICGFVGAGDGGGMNSQNLRRARAELQAIGGDQATSCLRQIEFENKR